LLLGAHYGVYGYAIAASLTAQGYPTWLAGYSTSLSIPTNVSRLYKKFYWPRVQRLQELVKQVTVLPGMTSQPDLDRIIEDKSDFLYLLPDQYFIVNVGEPPADYLVELTFLNRVVYLDISGMKPAKQKKTKVFTAIPSTDRRESCVEIQPMPWENSGLRPCDIQEDLQVYLSRLEQRLLENPGLWRDLRRVDLLSRFNNPGAESLIHWEQG
jgi:hypothetical protein